MKFSDFTPVTSLSSSDKLTGVSADGTKNIQIPTNMINLASTNITDFQSAVISLISAQKNIASGIPSLDSSKNVNTNTAINFGANVLTVTVNSTIDQNLSQTATVKFANVTIGNNPVVTTFNNRAATGNNIAPAIGDYSQSMITGLKTTDSPAFANVIIGTNSVVTTFNGRAPSGNNIAPAIGDYSQPMITGLTTSDAPVFAGIKTTAASYLSVPAAVPADASFTANSQLSIYTASNVINFKLKQSGGTTTTTPSLTAGVLTGIGTGVDQIVAQDGTNATNPFKLVLNVNSTAGSINSFQSSIGFIPLAINASKTTFNISLPSIKGQIEVQGESWFNKIAYFTLPTSEPADSSFASNQLGFWANSDVINAKFKKSDGTFSTFAFDSSHFTAQQLIASSNSAALRLTNTAGGTDLKNWTLEPFGSGDLFIQAYNDSMSNPAWAIQITRSASGGTPSVNQIYRAGNLSTFNVTSDPRVKELQKSISAADAFNVLTSDAMTAGVYKWTDKYLNYRTKKYKQVEQNIEFLSFDAYKIKSICSDAINVTDTKITDVYADADSSCDEYVMSLDMHYLNVLGLAAWPEVGKQIKKLRNEIEDLKSQLTIH